MCSEDYEQVNINLIHLNYNCQSHSKERLCATNQCLHLNKQEQISKL